MDILTLLRLITRHWRVTVPAMLLTLVGGVFVLQTSGPTYRAGGSAVLLSPPLVPGDTGAVPQGGGTTATTQAPNPYTQFSDLSVVADLVARRMASDASREALLQKGVTDYEIFANQFNRGPFIDVTGESDTPEGAVQSAEIVLDEVGTALRQIQEQDGGGNPDYFITADVLTRPGNAVALYGSTFRSTIAVMAIGSLLTLAAAVLAEALPGRWRAWQTARAAGDDSGPPAADAEHDGAHGAAAGPSPSPDESVGVHRLAHQRGTRREGAGEAGDGSSGAEAWTNKPDLESWVTSAPDGGGWAPTPSNGHSSASTDSNGGDSASTGSNGGDLASTGSNGGDPATTEPKHVRREPTGKSPRGRGGRGASAAKSKGGGWSTAKPKSGEAARDTPDRANRSGTDGST